MRIINNRYFQRNNGENYCYLADTAWTMPQKLCREDVDYYLNTRAAQGFNAVQICAISEFDGLRVPNAYGHLPFSGITSKDLPLNPNEEYWKHLDYIIDKAHGLSITAALLPTWGDKINKEAHGIGPEIFSEVNSFDFGRWIGQRYSCKENILWILGGDRALKTEKQAAAIDLMAKGIRAADTGHLMTFHPCGGTSSLQFLPNRKYIDFHSVQSGHGLECYESYKIIRETLEGEMKPCLDLECRYEDFPACFNTDFEYYWNDDDVRQNIYWNMMEGACGHVYGHSSVWCFNDKKTGEYPYTWREALERPGANQMKFAAALRLSRPYFEFRPAQELVANQPGGMAYIAAGRGDAFAFIYTPLGFPIEANLESISKGAVRAAWFNPRNGSVHQYAVLRPGVEWFIPPSSGKGCDWVLILDAV